MTTFRRVREFFGLQKSIVGLLSMVVFVGMGEKMAEQEGIAFERWRSDVELLMATGTRIEAVPVAAGQA